jgi:hypothetical protein
MQREFWSGKEWEGDLSKAEEFLDIAPAINWCKPLSLKAYVIYGHGQANEVEVYRNFTEGRSLTWGRRLGV